MTAGISKRRFASRLGDPGGWIKASDALQAGGSAAVTPAMRGRTKEDAFSRRVTGAGILREQLACKFPEKSGGFS